MNSLGACFRRCLPSPPAGSGAVFVLARRTRITTAAVEISTWLLSNSSCSPASALLTAVSSAHQLQGWVNSAHLDTDVHNCAFQTASCLFLSSWISFVPPLFCSAAATFCGRSAREEPEHWERRSGGARGEPECLGNAGCHGKCHMLTVR